MNTAARLIASILVAGSLLAACGDDDATSSGDGGPAVPAADTAFDGVKTALEPQGLSVANLPATSLNGAETGVDVAGDKTGTARLFSSSAKAEAYATRATRRLRSAPWSYSRPARRTRTSSPTPIESG